MPNFSLETLTEPTIDKSKAGILLIHQSHLRKDTHQTNKCSKWIIQTEKGVKYGQSQHYRHQNDVVFLKL